MGDIISEVKLKQYEIMVNLIKFYTSEVFKSALIEIVIFGGTVGFVYGNKNIPYIYFLILFPAVICVTFGVIKLVGFSQLEIVKDEISNLARE